MPASAHRRWLLLLVLLVPTAAVARAAEDAGVPAPGQDGARRTLVGQVLDSAGHGLSGVEIWGRLTLEVRLRLAEPRPIAVTDRNGAFTIQDPHPFETLTVCPPGYLSRTVGHDGPFPPGEAIELRLEPAGRITGRLVDARGEPVPGLWVWAQLASWSPGCGGGHGSLLPCPGSSRVQGAHTDRDGLFAFESLESGWFEVRAPSQAEPKVARRLAEAGRSAPEVKFVVPQRLARLVGRVVAAGGEPVDGASVSISGGMPGWSVATDVTGWFDFPQVVPGRQELRVSHPDLGWSTQEVQIGGQEAEVEIRMPPATPVEVRVLSPDGAPAAGAQLSAAGWSPVDRDAESRFRFGLPPGEHELVAWAPGWIGVKHRVTAIGEPIALDLELMRAATIAGRIVGVPSQNVRIELEDAERLHQAHADELGRFRTTALQPGAWTVTATDANGRRVARRIQLEAGDDATLDDLTFPPLPPVRGRVVDPGGRPVLAAAVRFVQGKRWVVADRTDAEGRFTAHLADGTWTAMAEQAGFGPAARTVTVAGRPVDVPDLQLLQPIAVSGALHGLEPGEVVVWVLATSADGIWERGGRADQDNRFVIPDLAPGDWDLSAELDDRSAGTRLRLVPGDTAVRVELHLTAEAAPEEP